MSDRITYTFDTTHHALWAEDIARDNAIPHEVVPAPPAANARCNIALETLETCQEGMSAALGAAGVKFGIYRG